MKNQNGGHGSGDELPVGIIDKRHTAPGSPRRWNKCNGKLNGMGNQRKPTPMKAQYSDAEREKTPSREETPQW